MTNTSATTLLLYYCIGPEGENWINWSSIKAQIWRQEGDRRSWNKMGKNLPESEGTLGEEREGIMGQNSPDGERAEGQAEQLTHL